MCVRERKLSSTEGVCSLARSLARYHVNVLCFQSTRFCKTREPLSVCQGCSMVMVAGPSGAAEQESASTVATVGLISMEPSWNGISHGCEELHFHNDMTEATLPPPTIA